MASFFPNGTIFSIGTAYGSAVDISGISNANPGVATAPAHGAADGDIVLVSSGWPGLDQQVVRVDSSDTNSFALEGLDTSNTTLFPAGAGGGSFKKVTAWVPFSQITNSASSGGDQQFYQWVYLEDGRQRQRPTFKNARSLQLTMDYDPLLPWHNAALSADRLGTPHAIRAALPNNDFIYYSMYVGFDGEPTMTANQNMQVSLSLSFANARSLRYTGA